MGIDAGYSNTVGFENVFLGGKSGYSNLNRHSNTFLGYQAGFDDINGAQNTYVGYAAGGGPTLANATAVGAFDKVLSSNSLVLGHKANVGIGISAPAFQLHLSTDAAAKAGSQTWTVASDSRLKRNITDFTDGLDLLKQIKPVLRT